MPAHITVPDEPTSTTFSVVASQSVFSVPWTYFRKEDIRVTVGGGDLAQNQFTHTGNPGTEGGFDGGTITLNAAVSNTTVVISRYVIAERTDDFGAGPVATRDLNTALDRLIAMVQDTRKSLADAASGLLFVKRFFTWNDTSDQQAVDVSVTDTQSGAGSLLMRLRRNGAAVLTLAKTGLLSLSGRLNVTLGASHNNQTGASVSGYKLTGYQQAEGGALIVGPPATLVSGTWDIPVDQQPQVFQSNRLAVVSAPLGGRLAEWRATSGDGTTIQGGAEIWTDGGLQLFSPVGHNVGLWPRGDGVIGITARTDPNTGTGFDVLRAGWETAAMGMDPAAVAVLQGMAGNRLAIQGQVIVDKSETGRMEWEGRANNQLIGFTPYRIATSNMNQLVIGQTGVAAGGYTCPMAATILSGRSEDIFQFGNYGGTSVTVLSRITSTGAFSGTAIIASGAGTFGGLITGTGGLSITGTSALQAVTATTVAASGNTTVGGTLTVTGQVNGLAPIVSRNSVQIQDAAGANGVGFYRMDLGTLGVGLGVLTNGQGAWRPLAASVMRTLPQTWAEIGDPTGRAGVRAYLTNGNVNPVGNYYAVVSGAGSFAAPVISDGTNWRIGG